MEEEQSKKNGLRLVAEARLAAMGEADPELSLLESRELIHELQTHQIELEMQNEALQKAEHALSKAHDELAELYYFSPIGYISLSDKAIVLQSNLMAASMLACERIELIGQVFSKYLSDSKAFGEYLHRCLHTEGRIFTEAKIKTKDGEIPVQLIGIAIDKNDKFNTKVVRLSISDFAAQRLPT
jgi:PAS domain-containing protein